MPHFCVRRRHCFLLILLLPLAALARFPDPPVLFDPPLSQRIASYDIDVTLAPDDHTLDGVQLLTWVNTGERPADELQFHLYLNGFRNTRSTYMLERGAFSRKMPLEPDGWGWIDVTGVVRLPGSGRPGFDARRDLLHGGPPAGTDLSGAMRFIQPDIPEHTLDRTVLAVALDSPLAPGDTLCLWMGFAARLPSPPMDRTGATSEFVFAGQWFPKIGVWGEAGWNCHQFHATGEFFADFGVYDVAMTVPGDYLLGATGLAVQPPLDNGDGTATHYYHAEDVHDFAWTASPEYAEFRGKAQDVDIRVLMQADHEEQGPRHVAAAKRAVEYFQTWYGDYPFPNLTVIDPRRGAGAVGGMEYPTLITAGTAYGMPEGVRIPEWVILHEFGHNYWYHLVASNEFEEAWLDEGINTYSEIQIMNDWFPRSGDVFDALSIDIDLQDYHRAMVLLGGDLDPMVKNAWTYYNGFSYQVNAYNRPGIALSSLHNFLGGDTMRQALRVYLQRWRFRHPTSADFIAVVEEVSGRDLDWFFDPLMNSNARMDYAVDAVFTRRTREPAGLEFGYSPQADTLAAPTESAVVDSVSVDSSAADSAAVAMWYSGVNLRRLGDFRAPVIVELVFADGDTLWEHWDGQDLWKKIRMTRAAPLVSAEIDPDRIWLMDVNLTNNSKAVEPPTLGLTKLSARWLFWVQFLLDQPELANFLPVVFNFMSAL